MGDTNYFSGIVKILETPKQHQIGVKNLITIFRVEVPQKRNNKIITLIFWGNLGHEVSKFYRIEDYILIEGYISLRTKKRTTSFNRISKQVIITVLRVYPILLNPNRNLRIS